MPNDDTPDDEPPDDVIPPDPSTDDMTSTFEEALAESATMDVPLDALIITQVNGGLQLERRAGVFDFDDGEARVGGVMASFLSDVPGTFAASSGFSAGNDSGLFGITTGADLMQTEGGARFTGGAVGLIIGPDGGVELRDGTSDVSVNFDDASLTATMSDFQIVDLIEDSETFVLVERPLDTIFVGCAHRTKVIRMVVLDPLDLDLQVHNRLVQFNALLLHFAQTLHCKPVGFLHLQRRTVRLIIHVEQVAQRLKREAETFALEDDAQAGPITC